MTGIGIYLALYLPAAGLAQFGVYSYGQYVGTGYVHYLTRALTVWLFALAGLLASIPMVIYNTR